MEYKMKNVVISLGFVILSVLLCGCQNQRSVKRSKNAFNFAKFIFEKPPTLNVFIRSIDINTGKVILRGNDNRKPSAPFTIKWGDGTTTEGLFPQEHTYSDRTKNYIVTIKANYPDSSFYSTEAFVRFIAPQMKTIPAGNKTPVTIPDIKIELGSRLPLEGMYKFSESLSFFTDDFFTLYPRKTIENILSVAAQVQMDLVNDDVFMKDNRFDQVLLRDADFGGMYSLWYTNPVSFGVGDYGLQGAVQWSSFFHEMGHNFTLNTPADYYFGGKTDGNANAIYSETMAQIFQHVTAYEMINNYKKYGLSEDLAYELRISANASFFWTVTAYNRYISSGMNFKTWNDPNSSHDETSGAFMSLAYKFFEHAELEKVDYCKALKRMMKFLQRFDEDWHRRYEPDKDTPEGESFRATMMVAALSYAFDEDLRQEFKDLNFAINDDVYLELLTGNN